MKSVLGHIARWAQLLVAVVFIFSSLTKVIDPVGTQIKIDEYLSAFGMDFLSGATVAMVFALIFAEFLLGALLLFRVAEKRTSRAVVVLVLLFTILTLVIAMTNPVSDCGCFGDVVKMSNNQTFVKNVILLLFALIIWLVNRHGENKMRVKSVVAVVLFSSLVGWAMVFSYRNLPLIETTPFRAGVNIPEAMAVPEDAEPDRYTTELHYRDKATGKVHVFSEQDTAWWDDSKWEFVETKTILVQKGFRPAIENFKLFGVAGDLTDSLLKKKNVFILIVQEPDAINDEVLRKSRAARDFAAENGLTCLLLTSHPEVESLNPAEVEVIRADATMLKTLLRSKAGAVLLDEGTIVAKWSINNLPDFSTLKGDFRVKAETYSAQREVFPYILITLFVVSIIVSYLYLRR